MINILGLEHEIKFSESEELKEKYDAQGIFDHSNNTIEIAYPPSDCNLDNPVKQMQDVIAHEVVHAYMNASGLQGLPWFQDEVLVSWIANMLDRMKGSVDDAKMVVAEVMQSRLESQSKS